MHTHTHTTHTHTHTHTHITHTTHAHTHTQPSCRGYHGEVQGDKRQERHGQVNVPHLLPAHGGGGGRAEGNPLILHVVMAAVDSASGSGLGVVGLPHKREGGRNIVMEL